MPLVKQFGPTPDQVNELLLRDEIHDKGVTSPMPFWRLEGVMAMPNGIVSLIP